MSKKLLTHYADCVNIAAELDQELVSKIGQDALAGFNEDKKSMEEWLSDVTKIEDLAALTIRKKNHPLPNSANVKLPIITKACYEFSSAVYPEIIRGDSVVKSAIIGYDDYKGTKKDKGERVTKYMNYQLLFENQEWEEELDCLLTMVGIIGLQYKKTYFDPVRKKVRSVLCDPKDIIINSDAKTLKSASRISEIIRLKLNNLIESKNTKYKEYSVYLEDVVDEIALLHKDDILDKSIEVVEQHCNLDLDEDGYAEPYIVTFTKEQGTVLRIAPRYTEDMICEENGVICYIDAVDIYTDFHFLKSPKGKFQSVGFGFLLLHLTEASNSVLNQLLDAGQLANMQGGYRDARLQMIPSGNSLHDPGEWKEIKVMTGASMKDGIVPINYKEPSNVLYQLLGFLYDVCRDLTASAQINNGTQSSANAKTGATQLLQEAGKKLTNSINKRIYRSLNKEFRNIFVLNSIYLDPKVYFNVLDSSLAVQKDDFDTKSIAIFPVADPELASDAKRMAAAQFVIQLVQSGMQGIDPLKATTFILQQTTIPDVMSIMADPNAKTPPNPDVLKLQMDAEHKAQQLNIEGRRVTNEEKDQLIKAHQAEADIELKKSQSLNYLAQAQAQPKKIELADLQLQLEAINKQIDAQLNLASLKHEKDSQVSDQQHQQVMQQADHSNDQTLQQTDIAQQPVDNSGTSNET